jgi:DNA helicase-2/ATP-dependent DNA helicase PcrA
VFALAALLSYLIDPVVIAPAGSGGRPTMVWASCNDPQKARHAPVAAPPFPVGLAHASIQKGFRGSTAGIRMPTPQLAGLLAYLDQVRADLAAATQAHQGGRGPAPQLTLTGVVARLLAFPQFRTVGFTPALFREALFTQLLEANVAPTRRSRTSLDRPLAPTRDPAGKIVWPDEMWTFLTVFGTLIKESDLDDIEDDAFAEHAVALLTFHQAKGLEFDHVYIGLTGRDPAPHAVLQTMLFSGQPVPYQINPDGQPQCTDPTVAQLALADRERELYVAMTRAKQRLTIMHDPADNRPMAALNPALATLFAAAPSRILPGGISERRWRP